MNIWSVEQPPGGLVCQLCSLAYELVATWR